MIEAKHSKQTSSHKIAKKLAKGIIGILRDSAGFDHWWEDVDPAFQKGIEAEIARHIFEAL